MLSRLEATLKTIGGLHVIENAPLSQHTRFALGGPARYFADASTESALAEAIRVARDASCPLEIIGGGSNLVASDDGYPGLVLRYTGSKLRNEPKDRSLITADSGAILKDLIDKTIAEGLQGLETMTGIPGWVGGAVYGNAGAYGHSIEERIEWVRFFDGSQIRQISRADCGFAYRESVFKSNKDWIILSVRLKLTPADAAGLDATAQGILKIRNEKYPPTLRCAGSIFKNLLLADLPQSVRAQVPERVIREGKVPAAYFLEQVGAKGLKVGGIEVASYHANLLFNAGSGSACQVRELVSDLKTRVLAAYGLLLEEEVQYLDNAPIKFPLAEQHPRAGLG